MTRNNRIAQTLETMLRGSGSITATNAALARQLQTSPSTISTLLNELARQGKLLRDRKRHLITWCDQPIAPATTSSGLRSTWTPGGIAVAALATAAIVIQLCLNAAHLGSAGGTPVETALLFATSTLITLLKVGFTTAGATLWARGQRTSAGLCLAIGMLGLTYDLMAATGYAGAKLADASAARASVIEQQSIVRDGLAALRTERTGLQARLAGVVAAEVAGLSGDRDCRLIQPRAQQGGSMPEKRPANEAACTRKRAVLGAELARAERVETIDALIAGREAELRAGRALSSADPSAEAIADLVNWSSGHELASPSGVRRVFLLVIVAALELASAFGFGVAQALSRGPTS